MKDSDGVEKEASLGNSCPTSRAGTRHFNPFNPFNSLQFPSMPSIPPIPSFPSTPGIEHFLEALELIATPLVLPCRSASETRGVGFGVEGRGSAPTKAEKRGCQPSEVHKAPLLACTRAPATEESQCGMGPHWLILTLFMKFAKA